MNHLKNTFKAYQRWKTVPPTGVALDRYFNACGTPACFGGHVATWTDLFPGVGSNEGRYPILGSLHHGMGVAVELFGYEDLFSKRHESREGTDHELVLLRLERHLVRLCEPFLGETTLENVIQHCAEFYS